MALAKSLPLDEARGELVGTDLPPYSALVGRSFAAGARRCIVENSLARCLCAGVGCRLMRAVRNGKEVGRRGTGRLGIHIANTGDR